MSEIYLISGSRSNTEEEQKLVEEYIEEQENKGNEVVYPLKDVEQDDETGWNIVYNEYESMKECDEVHVIWDPDSGGRHFDLGMAFALEKPLKRVRHMKEDNDGKSYWKVMKIWEERSKPKTLDYDIPDFVDITEEAETFIVNEGLQDAFHKLLDVLKDKKEMIVKVEVEPANLAFGIIVDRVISYKSNTFAVGTIVHVRDDIKSMEILLVEEDIQEDFKVVEPDLCSEFMITTK